MKIFFKRIILFLLFIFIIKNIAAETYYIGASLPLSGKNEKQGLAMKNALELYVELLNENGGIDGNQIELIIVDDKNDKTYVQEAVKKLAENDKVLAVIGHQYSSVAIAAQDIYKQNKLVNISPSASNPKVTKDSEWTFSMNYQDNLQGEFMAVYLKAIIQSKNVLIIHSDDAYGTGLNNSFVKKSKRINLNIIKTLKYSEENKFSEDFIEKKLKNEKNKIDGIVIFSHTDDGVKLVKQLRKYSINAPIIGPDSFSKQILIDGLGDDTANVFVASPFLYELASLKTIEFVNLYKEKYLEKYKLEPTLWAAFCYDALFMITEAIKNGNTTREGIKDYLKGINSSSKSLEGITGKLYFDQNGALLRQVVISMIDAGSFKPSFIQLKNVTEQHVLNNITEKINKNEVIIIDNIPYYKTKVVYAGIDFARINTVDVQGQNFDIEFFMWFRWVGDVDVENIDFINGIYGIEDKTEVLRKDFSKPIKYICYKIKGTYLTPYNLRMFPFDIQELPMTLAHKNKDANQIMLVVDSKNLSKSPIKAIYPEEWIYKSRNDFSGTYAQYSTFGDPSYTSASGKSKIDFSVYETRITIQRIILPYLLNMFLPLIIMIVISLLLFFIPTVQFDARMTLVMTALLSILVFHMAQGEALPNVGYLIKADLYFIISYILLFSLILNVIGVNLLIAKKKEKIAAKINKIFSFVFMPLSVITYLIISVISLV